MHHLVKSHKGRPGVLPSEVEGPQNSRLLSELGGQPGPRTQEVVFSFPELPGILRSSPPTPLGTTFLRNYIIGSQVFVEERQEE